MEVLSWPIEPEFFEVKYTDTTWQIVKSWPNQTFLFKVQYGHETLYCFNFEVDKVITNAQTIRIEGTTQDEVRSK